MVIIEDLEATAPSIHQHYSDEVSLAVRSALTDAELFISYNMPAKALGPLVAALPMAPNDLRLNQRLAALHTRASRFAEAALCCRTLQRVYSEADHPDEATRYGELAERYEERTSIRVPGVSGDEAPTSLDAALPISASNVSSLQSDEAEIEVPEFSIEEGSRRSQRTRGRHPKPRLRLQPLLLGRRLASTKPKAEPAEFAVADESSSAPAEAPAASEIDLSSEWDDAITVEAEAPAAETADSEVASHGSHETAESDQGHRDRRRDPVSIFLMACRRKPWQRWPSFKLLPATRRNSMRFAPKSKPLFNRPRKKRQPNRRWKSSQPAIFRLSKLRWKKLRVEEVYEPPVAAAHAIEVPAARLSGC